MNAKYFVGDVAFQLPVSATAGLSGGASVVKFVDVNAPSETEKRDTLTWETTVEALSVAAELV